MTHALDHATDFLALYMYACGESETPAEYHRWAALSLLAATVQDHVWVEKIRGAKLIPNLFVFLVGASGTGKNVAMDAASQLAVDLPSVNAYRARITAGHLLNKLASERRQAYSSSPKGGYPLAEAAARADKLLVTNPKMWLLTPELGMSVRSGSAMAEELINVTTDLWGGSYMPVHEGTRQHGEIEIRGACLNWMAGTTMAWLLRSVTLDAIEGGFFARVCVIDEAVDLAVRIYETRYAPDTEEVTAYLRARIGQIARDAKGEFELSPEANATMRQWYEQRAAPAEEALRPTWKREPMIVYKLAMLLALSRGLPERGGLRILRPDIEGAIRLAARTRKTLPKISREAKAVKAVERPAPEESAVATLRELVRKRKKVYETALLRESGLANGHFRDALATLVETREIATQRLTTGRMVAWVGRRLPQATEERTE